VRRKASGSHCPAEQQQVLGTDPTHHPLDRQTGGITDKVCNHPIEETHS
jgi:hypothetical protein